MTDLPTLADSTLSNALQALSRALLALGLESEPPDPRLADLITALPRLTESDVDTDGVCPICLVSFRAHLAEEELASVMESPAHAPEDLGVTRLESTCKHVFCRKDISTWIRQARNSCPTCRRPLLPSDAEPSNPSTDRSEYALSGSESSNSGDIVSNTNASTAMSDNNTASSTTANPSSAPSTTGIGSERPRTPDNPETEAARLVNDVIRDVLDRLSLGSDLTNTDLHTLLESVLPTLIPPISRTESSDTLDLAESEHEYPDRSEFSGMYS